jgi:hypothetical protein
LVILYHPVVLILGDKKMPDKSNFFKRRNNLGIITDVAIGAARGLEYGVCGNLLLTTAGYTLGGISVTAMAAAGAVGGAIVIIPYLLVLSPLMESLFDEDGHYEDMNLILRAAFETAASSVFIAGAGLVGAAIMGLALTPVVLSGLSANLAFKCFHLLLDALEKCGTRLNPPFDNLFDEKAAKSFS